MGNIILFALLAAVFYYIFKSYSRYEAFDKQVYQEVSTDYESLKHSDLGLFVALCAKVAKADGRVDSLEAELIKLMLDDVSAVFDEPQKTREILKQIFNEEKDRTDNIEQIARDFATALRRHKQQQVQFMGFLIQLAFVDGEVSPNEEEILKLIAESLAFDPNIYHKLFDQFEQMHTQREASTATSLEDAYKTLGVSENDDMTTIKKAYRKLVKQYHPDIIKAQGKSEEYLQEATAKTQQINEAYELIKKSRGD
ncbi:MAG: TerB family tellurite resistance protein [Epsilonproteobacteria bacterium]|nr:TerB family tellurite resistance protein [Campylobacterota bacterium]